MEDRDLKKKRWSVTYTKHLHQKRKTYQDGFLDLHLITNKVMLLDDCEKLLECRILKEEKAVRPGETLSFNAFLVDVGDPEGDHHQKPVTVSKVFESPRPSGFVVRKKFRSPSFCSGNGKDSVEKDDVRIGNFSSSRQVIREFKKSELQRYGASKGYLDVAKPSVTEWQVMYTTHLTQKAKKYHDGFLQLAICGSQGRQVMLHDLGRKLLTSRFLKKDEVVKSDETIPFDGYLVEIGELVEERKPLVELNIQQTSCSTVGKTRPVHKQQYHFTSDASGGKEFERMQVHNCKVPESHADIAESSTSAWQVMYTTQVTQKAKKYHDGFLRLVNSGTLGRQIMLYDASRKLLNSRFLKKAERISSGDSIAFDAHLVDIGEPEGENQLQEGLNAEGRKSSNVNESGNMHGHQNGYRDSKPVAKEWRVLYTNQITQKSKKYHSGILRLASCGSYQMQVTLLGEDRTILSSKFLHSSEDMKEGSMLALPKYLVEIGELCVSSEGKPQDGAYVIESSESDFSISRADDVRILKRVSLNKTSHSENDHNIAILKEDADSCHTATEDRTRFSKNVQTNKPLRDAHQILSILQKPVAKLSTDVQQTDKVTASLIHSDKEFQVSDVDVVYSEEIIPAKESSPNQRTSESTYIPGKIIDVGGAADMDSSNAITTSNGDKSSNDSEAGNDQLNPDIVEAAMKGQDQPKSGKEVDELPNFDLGF